MNLGYCISGYLDGLETFISNKKFEDYRGLVNKTYGKSLIKQVWVLDTQDFRFNDDLILGCSRLFMNNKIYFGFNIFTRALDAENRGAYISYMLTIENYTGKANEIYACLVAMENVFSTCIQGNSIDKSKINPTLVKNIESDISNRIGKIILSEANIDKRQYQFSDSMVILKEDLPSETDFFDVIYSMKAPVKSVLNYIYLSNPSSIIDSSKYKLASSSIIEILKSSLKEGHTQQSFLRPLFFPEGLRPKYIKIPEEEYNGLKSIIADKNRIIENKNLEIANKEKTISELKSLLQYKKNELLNLNNRVNALEGDKNDEDRKKPETKNNENLMPKKARKGCIRFFFPIVVIICLLLYIILLNKQIIE